MCRCQQLMYVFPVLRWLKVFSQTWEGDVTMVLPSSFMQLKKSVTNPSNQDLLDACKQVCSIILAQPEVTINVDAFLYARGDSAYMRPECQPRALHSPHPAPAPRMSLVHSSCCTYRLHACLGSSQPGSSTRGHGCMQGERVTWAKLPAIQANCGIEMTLDECMLELSEMMAMRKQVTGLYRMARAHPGRPLPAAAAKLRKRIPSWINLSAMGERHVPGLLSAGYS